MDGRGEDLHKMFAAGNEKYLHYVKSNYITSKNISYLIYILSIEKYLSSTKNISTALKFFVPPKLFTPDLR